MANRNDECEKAIKFMSNSIKDYTKPESLSRWCELAKTKTGYDKCAHSFSRSITRRLDKIEDLQGFTLMEKVHLVFVLSRPVSPGFLEILKEAKCVVKLNDDRKMTYFSSPDGTCVLQSNHNKLDRSFKGKPYFPKRRKAETQVRSSENVRNLKQENKAQSIGNKRFQNFLQNDQKRVKIEDFLEEIEQPPEEWIPDEKAEMPTPNISLLKLVEQMETLAFNINLEDCFQEKALRAVRLFKANDQAIPIQDFNQLFNVFLASLKRERTRNSNENSMQLSRLFKHLQRTLIRPLGEDLMTEALGILDDEIQKLEGNGEKIPLKTVQVKIDGLMSLLTSYWAKMDE